MAYFPMCVDIAGRTVILVGSGPQIRDKMEKLAAFSPKLIRLDRLTQEDLLAEPAFVIAGDLDEAEAESVALLCAQRRIPLNVVDVPRLCTFSFPSLIVRGDLSVGISTGGKAPGASAHIRRTLEQALPARTDELLRWLSQIRPQIRAAYPPPQRAQILGALTDEALRLGRPLSAEEQAAILSQNPHECGGM